jgi:hypothetical protein
LLVQALRTYVLARENAAAEGGVSFDLHFSALAGMRENLVTQFGESTAVAYWQWLQQALADARHWWGSQLAELVSLAKPERRDISNAGPLATGLFAAVDAFERSRRLLDRRIDELRGWPPSEWDNHIGEYHISTGTSPLDGLQSLCSNELWRRTWTAAKVPISTPTVSELTEAMRPFVKAPGFYDHRSVLWGST